jgi:hypothetical protein
MKKPHVRSTRAAALLLPVFFAGAAAWAVPIAATSDMELELARFVRAYRVGDSADQAMRLALAAQAQTAAPPQRKLLKCISDGLPRDALEAASLDFAREQFHDLHNLQEINRFFEGPAGRSVVDQSLRDIEDRAAEARQGREPRPPRLPVLTASQQALAVAFDRSPASADFKRYVEVGLRNLGTNPKFVERMKAVRAACGT